MEHLKSRKLFQFGRGRVSLCIGRGPFNADAMIVEHRENDHRWAEGTDCSAVHLIPRLESTGKDAASYISLNNSPETIRDLAEHLLELADEIENTIDQHKADHGI